MIWPNLLCLAVTLLMAFWSDIRTMKIKNKLNVTAALSGLIINFITRGSSGLVDALMGLVVGFTLLFILYIAGGVGAGDVKLFAAIGAIMGPSYVSDAFSYSAVWALIIGLVLFVARGEVAERLKGLKEALFAMFLFRGLKPLKEFSVDKGLKIPFMYAVLPGTIFAWLLPLHIIF